MPEQSMSALVKEFEDAEKAEREADEKLERARARKAELSQELVKRLDLQTASSPNRGGTGKGAPKVKLTEDEEEDIRRRFRDGASKAEIKDALGTDGRILNRLEREVREQAGT